jgi:uncharacterized damage-inducible protein DinB
MNTNFSIEKTIEILERTPLVLETLLNGLSDDWIHASEGENTWSPYDVVGHLVHGEKTDWIARINKILNDERDKNFEPFDRFAQFEESKGKTMNDLLEEFKTLRKENLLFLKGIDFSPELFKKTGIHPSFGTVTLQQLLSTWAVHDMAHTAQIARVLAKHFGNEVGPWEEYFRILQ